jgi:hypothetical protein
MDAASRWARGFAQRWVVQMPAADEEILYEGVVSKKPMLRKQWNPRRMMLTPKRVYFFEGAESDRPPTEAFELSRVLELWHACSTGRFELLCQRKYGLGNRTVEFSATSASRAVAIREGFERALDHIRLENTIELNLHSAQPLSDRVPVKKMQL